MTESVQAEDAARPDDAELITLDEVFDEKSDEGEKSEQETAEAKAEEPEAAPDEPEGQEAEQEGNEAKAEDDGETPAPEPKDEPWHIKAVMDEREKRQAAQKEVEALKKQLEDATRGDEKHVSVFEDEEGFTNQLMTQFEQKALNDRLNMSQALAEREFGRDSVAEKVATFKELAQDNPELVQKVNGHPLPYHELIEIVDKHNELKQMENIDEYKARIKAEARAEVEAELASKQEAEEAKRKSISPSLASKRSAGGVKEETTLIGADDAIPE